jgi:radical SAM protein with 4Fe4S-binding SPASM domain
MSKVVVMPGSNAAGDTPYGSCTIQSSGWRVAPAYTGSGDWAHDLAVIDDVPIAAPNGKYFGFLNATPSDRMPIVVCGYSAQSDAIPELTAAIDGEKQHLHGGYAAEQSGPEVIEYNILTLVSKANVLHGREVYRYLTGEGHNYLQFIPCVEHADFGISGLEWGRFLLEVFEEWLKGNDRYRVSIRHIDSALSILARGQTTACTTSGKCAGYFAVEHDGSVYPCDFYVDPELKLGAVSDEGFSWEKMGAHPLYQSFGARKADWGACSDCRYLALCSGDCPKHRDFTQGHPKSHLCSGWTLYYEKALPELTNIARSLTPDGILFTEKPIRRNEPCFCGSGLKSKKCHNLGG